MAVYKPIEYYNETLSVLKNSKFPDFKKKGEEVHKYLIEQWKKYPDPCSDRMKNIYLKFLDHIDYEKLSTLVTKQFYNIELMETMTCLVNSVLTSEQDYIDYLTNPTLLKIDPKKLDLLVFFTAFLNGKDKILTFKYDKENTLEEGMVGLLALNSIRSTIPTFAWIYGFTKCNLPIFTKSGNKYEVVTACRKSVEFGKKDYIGMISEYIKGPTLIDYVKTPQGVNVREVTVKEVLSSLLTILYSLKYANEKFKYVHWDLHQNNVLMRELDSNDSYIYLPDMDEYLWVGKYLATIIDYGLSSFEYEGEIISKYEFSEYGINPELSTSPLNDFFKLINSLYPITLNDYNKNKTNQIAKDKFKTIQEIYGLFLGTNNANDIFEVEEKSGKNYAIFPNAPKYTIDDFVKKVSKNITNIDDIILAVKNISKKQNLNLITKNKPAIVLSCDKTVCIQEAMMEQILMIKNEPIVLQEAKILSSRLDESDKDYQKDKKILDKFLIDYLDNIYARVNKYINVKPSVNVDMIYLFNDLRLMENQLKILDTIVTETQNRELFDRIQKQKDIIYKLVNDIYISVEKNLKDKSIDYHMTTYKPESVKTASYLQLQSDFDDLINTSKNPPYIPPPKSKLPVDPLFVPVRQQTAKKSLTPESKKEDIVFEIEPSQDVMPSKSTQPSEDVSIFMPRKSTRKIEQPLLRAPSERLKSGSSKSERPKSELISSIPLPQREGSSLTMGSSVPVGKKESSPESRKNLFVSQLKKYERLLEGQKGTFIKSNLGKTKVKNMYEFVVQNKNVVDSDLRLKADIKKKMELIKNLNDEYIELIDGYMKRLNI